MDTPGEAEPGGTYPQRPAPLTAEDIALCSNDNVPGNIHSISMDDSLIDSDGSAPVPVYDVEIVTTTHEPMEAPVEDSPKLVPALAALGSTAVPIAAEAPDHESPKLVPALAALGISVGLSVVTPCLELGPVPMTDVFGGTALETGLDPDMDGDTSDVSEGTPATGAADFQEEMAEASRGAIRSVWNPAEPRIKGARVPKTPAAPRILPAGADGTSHITGHYVTCT